MTVQGVVAGGFCSPKSERRFIHFGDAYPKHTLSVRYDPDKTPEMGGVADSTFVGRRVEVTGLVEAHKPVPTIVLTSRDQIKLLPVDEAILKRTDLDGETDAKNYIQAWRQVLHRREFDVLEKAARELRNNKTLDATGGWLLGLFYDGMTTEDGATPEEWEKQKELLEDWVDKYPDSITAHVALAMFWEEFALSVFPDYPMKSDVPPTDEQEELLYKREAKAAEAIRVAGTLQEKCPEYYVALLHIGPDEHTSEEAIFEKAIAYEPDYRRYYYTYGTFLAFNGDPGSWEKLIRAHTDSNNPAELLRYAWVVQAVGHAAYRKSSVFHETEASWDLTKKGYQEMRKTYPHSKWILNSFAKMAGEANDPETARALLPELEKNIDMAAWYSWSNYQFFLDWTRSPGGAIWF